MANLTDTCGDTGTGWIFLYKTTVWIEKLHIFITIIRRCDTGLNQLAIDQAKTV